MVSSSVENASKCISVLLRNGHISGKSFDIVNLEFDVMLTQNRLAKARCKRLRQLYERELYVKQAALAAAILAQ